MTNDAALMFIVLYHVTVGMLAPTSLHKLPHPASVMYELCTSMLSLTVINMSTRSRN